MAALTSTNYVGDTSFGFTVRVIGSVVSSLVIFDDSVTDNLR